LKEGIRGQESGLSNQHWLRLSCPTWTFPFIFLPFKNTTCLSNCSWRLYGQETLQILPLSFRKRLSRYTCSDAYDVWIELSPENTDNVIQALDAFGFGTLGLKPEDFLENDQIIQLGYPPNKINILTTLKEIKFEDCYKARVEVDIQGLKINFIDLQNLKHNKRATGRPQDLADAENLE